MTNNTDEQDVWMIWPCGTMALLEDMEAGDYDFMSDDYCRATDEEVSNHINNLNNVVEDRVRHHNLTNEDQVTLVSKDTHFGKIYVANFGGV
jgi:hypothetical protein